jgi:EpsI family protein
MRAWLLGAILIATSALTVIVRPDAAAASAESVVDLAQLLPERFGNWRLDERVTPIAIGPDTPNGTMPAYAKMLERIYVDDHDRRVMLSVAYSKQQFGDQLQAHRPEYCYKAQGFTIGAVSDGALATAHGPLPIRRLHASRPGRSEPVSYWLTVGDQAALPGLARKVAQLRQSLAGTIPDGMLVRVSSIDDSTLDAYAVHDRFLSDLLATLPETSRVRLTGRILRPMTPNHSTATDRPIKEIQWQHPTP